MIVILIIKGQKICSFENVESGTKFSLELSEKPQFNEFRKYEPNNPKFRT